MSKKTKYLSCFLAVLLLCSAIYYFPEPTYSKEITESVIAAGDERNAARTAESFTFANEKRTSAFQTSGRIWIAGDSIAADHSYENESDYARFVHGWGEMLGNYLTEDAQVFNLAISGQTAKFFTEENNYRQIMDGIGEGDLLLIQFGHNDYKSAGSDHSTLSTDTEGSYKWYLKNYYIDPALRAGAMPVLCTSVVLCSFNEDIISENQAQNKFAEAMRELYQEYCEQGIEIGLIDTYSLTETMLNADSARASEYFALKYDRSGYYFDELDGTDIFSTSLDHVHFSEKGADAAADIISQNLFLMYQDFNRFNKKGITDGGDGTQEEPYLISTLAQFYQILQDDQRNTPETYYQLTADLMPFIQQQQWKTAFYANLDGGGHSLKNAFGTAISAFLDENHGTIQNMYLEYHLEHSIDDFQYPFVKDNYGVIENCQSKGTISLTYYPREESSLWHCGLFAAVNHEGAFIRGCRNETRVKLDTDVTHVYLGGIAGRNEGALSDCENSADLNIITSEYTTSNAPALEEVVCCGGGIAGIASDNAEFLNCRGNKNPYCYTTLQAKSSVILTDSIVAVTDGRLRTLLEQSISTEAPKTENPSTAKPLQLNGDLDEDGKVSLNDAQLALRIALGIVNAAPNQLKAADLNENGVVELSEVQMILEIALGISNN